MKIINRILIGINIAFFIIAGLFGASISLNQNANVWWVNMVQTIADYLNHSMIARTTVLIISLLLILVAVLTIIGNIENRRAERTVILQSPHGDIKVSLKAIEDFSRIVKNEVKGVKEIKGKVLSKRKGLDVTAKVTLFSDRAVAEVTQEIQEAIIRYIQYTLGIETPIKPTVVVSKVIYKSPEEEKKNE
ncbi:MAG: alkaline shock response membrane anchor protein AmaP [Candidatus Goldbacteria bacterium]|nr:alkaline shock response membrane anchor protein AmaP [Candidatus Goldiibacteriota bacterium]